MDNVTQNRILKPDELDSDELRIFNIINSLSDDSNDTVKNIDILKDNFKLIEEFMRTRVFLNTIVKLPCDEKKILIFLQLVCYLMDNDLRCNYFYRPDKDGNYFSHVAVDCERDLNFIINVFRYIKGDYTKDEFDAFLNKIDSNHEHFIHKLLKHKIKKNNYIRITDFEFSILNDYNFDFTIPNSNGETVLDFINSLDEDKNFFFKSTSYKLKKIILKKNFLRAKQATIYDLLLMLNGDKVHDLYFINEVIGDINYSDKTGNLLAYVSNYSEDIIHHFTFNHNFWERGNKIINSLQMHNRTFEITKILLNLGVDPNYDVKNLINIIYRYDYTVSQMLEILQLCIDNGYDVNSKPTLINTIIKKEDIDSFSILEIYKYLCKNGFDSKFADVDEKMLKERLKSRDKKTDFHILWLYDTNCNIIILKNKLRYFGYTLDDEVIKKFTDIFEEFYQIKHNIQRVTGDTLDIQFNSKWYEAIIENRQISGLAPFEKITLEETLEALKKVIEDEHKKLLGNISKGKKMLLEYK